MNNKQTEWTKRKTDGVMDYLAKEMIATFIGLGFDEAYIQDQRNALVGKNRFEVLLWCNNNLDARCKAALAEQLGVEEENLNIALNIVAGLEAKQKLE